MLLLALTGCVSHRDHVGQLIEAGWGDQVLRPMRFRQRYRHQETIWGAAEVTVAMEVVPTEAFAIAPRGYGESWWMVAVGFDRRRGLTPELSLKATFDALETCSSCTEDWIRNQMASPHLPPERRSSGGGRRRLRGPLGRLLGGLGELTKLVGSIVLMPMAFAADLGLAMTGVTTTKNALYKPFGLTRFTWSAMTGQSSGGGTPVQAAPSSADRGFRCTHDGPCSGTLVVQGTEPPTEVVLALTLANGMSRSAVIPLSGSSLDAALQAAVPSDGIVLDLREVTP